MANKYNSNQDAGSNKKANRDDIVIFEGLIIDVLPSSWFKIKIDGSETQILATLSGKMRMNKIRLLKGDRVRIETSTYDLTRGRVTCRL